MGKDRETLNRLVCPRKCKLFHTCRVKREDGVENGVGGERDPVGSSGIYSLTGKELGDPLSKQ